MRPPTPTASTRYACHSSAPCASSAATSPGRRVFPPDRLPPVHTPRHRRDPPPAQPGQTPPHLPARHQTSQRHQIPTKSPRPQQHQPPRTTRNPTPPPTKLTALVLESGCYCPDL